MKLSSISFILKCFPASIEMCLPFSKNAVRGEIIVLAPKHKDPYNSGNGESKKVEPSPPKFTVRVIIRLNNDLPQFPFFQTVLRYVLSPLILFRKIILIRH